MNPAVSPRNNPDEPPAVSPRSKPDEPPTGFSPKQWLVSFMPQHRHDLENSAYMLPISSSVDPVARPTRGHQVTTSVTVHQHDGLETPVIPICNDPENSGEPTAGPSWRDTSSPPVLSVEVLSREPEPVQGLLRRPAVCSPPALPPRNKLRSEDHLESTDTSPQTEQLGTDPAVTDAPATDPPVTDAPATDAPVTEPPASDAPALPPRSKPRSGAHLESTNTPTQTDPPQTDPPVTDPPMIEPPVTEPPATDPLATDSPATEPPALPPRSKPRSGAHLESTDTPSQMDPHQTDPPATDPPGTEPSGTDPPGSEPSGTDPPGSEPSGTYPPETEPSC